MGFVDDLGEESVLQLDFNIMTKGVREGSLVTYKEVRKMQWERNSSFSKKQPKPKCSIPGTRRSPEPLRILSEDADLRG